MDKKRYKDLVNIYTPKENKIYNILKAFIIGGFLGIIGQFVIDLLITYGEIPKNEASTYMIIILIFIASLFTAMGFFDTLVGKA
ncbi:MAG: SpoVA/SpoVAEb family sporulation membrane protein, partial [Bacilli bacterium]|nr:SpoVA/SpoVAEb family sporulation membrane protein [Bacilli bacterium]